MPVVSGTIVSPLVTLRCLDIFFCFLWLRCLKKDKACVGMFRQEWQWFVCCEKVGHAKWQGEWAENTFFIDVKR